MIRRQDDRAPELWHGVRDGADAATGVEEREADGAADGGRPLGRESGADDELEEFSGEAEDGGLERLHAVLGVYELLAALGFYQLRAIVLKRLDVGTVDCYLSIDGGYGRV